MQSDALNILANVFSLIGATALVLSGAAKSKEGTFKLQIVDCAAHTIANILLGGWSGAIAVALSLVRAIISVKGKTTNTTQTILCAMMIIFGVAFNRIGPIGILPIISNVGYTIVGCSKYADFKRLKISLIISMLLWTVYDFAIGAYPTVAADIITAGMCVYAIAKNRNNTVEYKKAVVLRHEEMMCA